MGTKIDRILNFSVSSFTDTYSDFFGRSKTLSEQLRHSRSPAHHNPPDPGPYHGYGPGNRYTGGLPPYAPVAPGYQSEMKPSGPSEAGGAMIPGHGGGTHHMGSPEMRQAENYGFGYGDSAQNMQMR